MRWRRCLSFCRWWRLSSECSASSSWLGHITQRAKKLLLKVLWEVPVLTHTRPVWHLRPARHDGSGVTMNDTADNDLVLLAGFFERGNQIRLIRRDGSVVARWPLAFSKIVTDTHYIRTPPETDWNTDTHGALILPDGSVVFVFEYGGLVKLDRCGEVLWTVARQAHHSVERAEGGGYWAPGRRYVPGEATPRFPPFKAPYFEDTLLKISEDGRYCSSYRSLSFYTRTTWRLPDRKYRDTDTRRDHPSQQDRRIEY